MPQIPYRGIHPFRYVDHPIFFAREEETRHLLQLVTVYRGVMLYGDSGCGKSSLSNAGLLPAAIQLGFTPERVRVQPRPGEEIVVERISLAEDGGAPYVPTWLTPAEEDSPVHVLSCDEFAQKVREAATSSRPLVVFDQFEELVTLFEESGAQRSQQCIVEMTSALLRDELPVKLVFAFRDDYLARVKPLLAVAPELVDQSLRLTPPSPEALPRIIRGPFEDHPNHFERELDPALAQSLCEALSDRFGSGDVSLSEVQTVCLRLWRSDDPAAELEAKGVQGLLEDYLGEELDRFPEDLRYAAGALLSQMVTPAGTRNVIAAEDLIVRVQEEEKIPRERLERALDRLEGESKLVRRERRLDLYLYEITSEFLVPWISRRREELIRHREQRRFRRRLALSGGIGASIAIVAVLASLGFVWALDKRDEAQSKKREAEASAEVARATLRLGTDPASALPIALRAARALSAPGEAHDQAMRVLFRAALFSNLEAVLNHAEKTQVIAARFRDAGKKLVTVDAGGKVSVWGVDPPRRLDAFPTGRKAEEAVFSRNGAVLAIRSATGWTLWDTGSRRRIAVLPGGQLAVSPDGHNVALTANGQPPRVRLFAVGARGISEKRPVTFDREAVRKVVAVTFLADSRRLLTMSQYGGWIIWDTRTGQPTAEIAAAATEPLRSAPGKVVAATASPDGLVAVAINQGQVRLQGRVWVYDAETGAQERAPWLGLPLSNLVSSDEGSFVLAFQDGSIQIWKPRSNAAAIPIRGYTRPVTSIALSPDGEWVALASAEDQTAKIFDTKTGDQRANLMGHTDGIRGMQFSPDGREIVTTSDDGAARLWRTLSTGSDIALPRHAAEVGEVRFSHDGESVLTASVDGSTFLVRASTGRLMRAFDKARSLKQALRRPLEKTSGARPNAVWLAFGPRTALSANGLRLITGSYASGRVTLWAVRNGKRVRLIGRKVFPQSAFLDLGPRRIWGAVPTSSNVLLFDQRTGRRLRPFGNGSLPFAAAASEGNGRYLVVAQVNEPGSRLTVWDIPARRAVLKTGSIAPHAYEVVAIDRAGAYVAGGTSNRIVRIWRIRDGRLMAKRRLDGRLRALAFSPRGDVLATVTDGQVADLWLVPSGRRHHRLRGHTGGINSVEFSADGRLVVTASDDGTVRVWKVSDGIVLAQLRGGRQGRALDASFSPDGRSIAVGASDGSSDVFACPVCGGEEALLRFAEQRASYADVP